MLTMPDMKLSAGASNFIDDAQLEGLLRRPAPSPQRFGELLAKSLAKQALTVEETAELLCADDPELIEQSFEAARQLKRDVYGNRIVLFAPLYIGNQCVNDCGYCAFRSSNPEAVRHSLDADEVRRQVIALQAVGHKRLILVFGEHPRYDAATIAETVRNVYAVKTGHGEIRRININAAPLDVEGYRIVKASGIGTYQVFQETYHQETYRRYHPARTRKGDFLYRLDALSRAQEAGIDDVGIGALFGLYDWRFEVLGLVRHAWYLQDRFGVGPHTISFPRLRPAQGITFDQRYFVSDDHFKRLVAALRLAVPYTGMILTARERPELRREVLAFGVSQIDAGSRIELGGYTKVGDAQQMEHEQFELGDIRSLDEVLQHLLEDGYIPSFCTACYRLGRTGEHFMEYAIPGFIQRLCTPNALLTLMEYVVDYGSPQTQATAEKLILAEIEKIDNPALKQDVVARLHEIKTTDKRDLHY